MSPRGSRLTFLLERACNAQAVRQDERQQASDLELHRKAIEASKRHYAGGTGLYALWPEASRPPDPPVLTPPASPGKDPVASEQDDDIPRHDTPLHPPIFADRALRDPWDSWARKDEWEAKTEARRNARRLSFSKDGIVLAKQPIPPGAALDSAAGTPAGSSGAVEACLTKSLTPRKRQAARLLVPAAIPDPDLIAARPTSEPAPFLKPQQPIPIPGAVQILPQERARTSAPHRLRQSFLEYVRTLQEGNYDNEVFDSEDGESYSG
ncbi:hypothetical protein K470DRAFT_268258 [Piedraia hortae CBS 480.64]|uniref:Uncharacterized protein n=1 Tax=Piedraia hortae CBS 480.64 TaxID=1314780 RepID=A0A6A7C7S6_9PEZI|nr:hypothetical protein K470DRAFT_268258 [Piedraia hortae CBS 480.64]